MQSDSSSQDVPDPGLIFRTLNAHQQSAALCGAIELDVFSSIAKGQQTSSALAKACQADARAMRILCDFLVVYGFLNKQDEKYSLTSTSATFLDRDSASYMGAIAGFVNSPPLLRAFDDVAELVRQGGTQLEGAGTVETEFDGWVTYAECMVPLVIPSANFIAELVAQRKPGPIKVLDIAAGHGMFGIRVAQQNPEASVVAIDWEAVLSVADKNAKQAGISNRYTLHAGDALTLDYGRDYDLVLIPNFFHHFDRKTCCSIMEKIRDCLKDGGLAATLEFVPNEDRVSPPAPATFSFMMLGTTPNGEAYTFDDYRSMWTEAGVSNHEMIDVPQSEQRLILSMR